MGARRGEDGDSCLGGSAIGLLGGSFCIDPNASLGFSAPLLAPSLPSASGSCGVGPAPVVVGWGGCTVVLVLGSSYLPLPRSAVMLAVFMAWWWLLFPLCLSLHVSVVPSFPRLRWLSGPPPNFNMWVSVVCCCFVVVWTGSLAFSLPSAAGRLVVCHSPSTFGWGVYLVVTPGGPSPNL